MIFISLKRLQTTATIHKANKNLRQVTYVACLFCIDNCKNVWYNINTTFLAVIFYDIDNLKKHVWIFGFLNILFCRVE